MTALLGAARVSIDQVSHDYAELGLLGYWKLLSTGLTAARDSRGGTVAELALRGRLGQLGLVGKRAELRDGILSETFKSGLGAIRSRTSLELSGQLPDPDRPWVSLGLSGTRDQLVAGGSSETLDVRLGTSLGGWRVIRTLGSRLIHLRTYQGFSAETAASTTILINTLGGIPISTTHSITGAIMGVGAVRGAKAVHWGVGRKIVFAWIVTFPICIVAGAIMYLLLHACGM